MGVQIYVNQFFGLQNFVPWMLAGSAKRVPSSLKMNDDFLRIRKKIGLKEKGVKYFILQNDLISVNF